MAAFIHAGGIKITNTEPLEKYERILSSGVLFTLSTITKRIILWGLKI